MAKQFICGTSGKAALTNAMGDNPAIMTMDEYEGACGKSMEIPLSKAELEAKAAEYSDPANAAKLMSGSGGSIMSQITKYFYPTCVPSCDLAKGGVVQNGRQY